MYRKYAVVTLTLSLLMLLCVAPIASAQEDIFPEAEIINDEGGPTVITGEVTYTNPFFTTGVAQPIVILEDQAGFVDRNEYYVFPPESQTLGQITSDFYTSPFTYSIALPAEPGGALRDVDNDGESDAGIMVFAIAYWSNTWGDPFLEVRDLYGGGWSTAYASTKISEDPEKLREIIGGHLLVYARDDEQGFPSSFGEDELLFTEDDPIVGIPQGYTVVNLDTDPFTFDRGRHQEIDLIEPETAALVDYGNLSFTEAFDEMLEKLSQEYAFTEYKNIDWEALGEEFRPRFVEADESNDDMAYLNALREFLWSIPDGHVGLSPFSPFVRDFQFDIARGIGLAIQETDDGRALVIFLLDGGPADEAGIELGAEILEINGTPISEHIAAQEPWTQPFSTEHVKRLEQARYATRFDVNTESVTVQYSNPGDDSSATVSLPAVGEGESFNQTIRGRELEEFQLPVEYELLDSGYAYVTISSFNDNTVLTIQLWERMIREVREAEVPGVIVDMRFNGGGNGFLADQMTAYFFDEALVVGQRGSYNEELGEFFFDPRGVQELYLPAEELRYHGPLAVLVGPDCASACERFAYDLTLQDRAAVVGQYPTAGLGGGVNDFSMPLNMTIRFTASRSVDADGNIHIEGKGVVPTVDVPVNEEMLFAEDDPVLEAAVAHLQGTTTIPTIDGGAIEVSDTVVGEFTEGQRVRYILELHGEQRIDVFLGSEENITTVLRFYDEEGNLLLSNEDTQEANSGDSLMQGLGSQTDLTVIIEVGTYNDAFAGPYILRIKETSS